MFCSRRKNCVGDLRLRKRFKTKKKNSLLSPAILKYTFDYYSLHLYRKNYVMANGH